ncbi:MAG TPA: thiamine ABC transporter substrate-binding protein [Dehalococcoidia bacterium]|nr:thiamine ABC transporter substrate-binding protein [Dehalococcoidia bacterium]
MLRFLSLTLATLALVLSACGGDDDGEGSDTLRLLTHDSFLIDEGVIEQFEAEQGVEVEIIQGGDAGSVVNSAILNAGNPVADVLFGVDNTFLGRALEAELFVEYVSPELENVDDRFELSEFVTPIDYGYVNLNYDVEGLQAEGLDPPETLEEILAPEWNGLLVAENPATSSPGLAFLAATVAYFGEDDDYDYLDYWSDLRANGLEVTDDWTTAYYTSFSRYGGDNPLVVSYTTSPACEVIFAETPIDEPPTGNVLPPQGSFEQIEFAGILAGTENEELAGEFIDFMLSETFQEAFPDDMCVFPVRDGVTLPEAFEFAQPPERPADIDFETIDENRDEWIEAWIGVVLR